MVLDNHLEKMDAATFCYRYTLIELVRKGIHRKQARKMLETTNFVTRAEESPQIFYHYEPESWADLVIQNYNAMNENMP